MWHCGTSERRKVYPFQLSIQREGTISELSVLYDRTECRRDHVPDERLNKLAEIEHPQRVIPTTVEIVDIAGLVKGASKGEGLGNKFLANIRETDAILHVLRCFDDDNIVHVDGRVDPVRDKEIIDYELQIKDLETIDSRIAKVQKQAQTGGDKQAKIAYEVLCKYKEALEQGKSARTVSFDTKDEERIAHDLFLLTDKPVMYVL